MKLRQGIICIFLLLFVGFACEIAEGSLSISRDDKGVWFITGDEFDTIYDVFETKGYAVAFDRLWQAERYRRMAKGELAEIFGPDFLGQDRLARIKGYSDAELTSGYQNLDTEVQDMIKGYVDGFNRRINEVVENPDQLPYEFHAIAQQTGNSQFLPKPWTVEDVLAWQAALSRQFDSEANKQGQIDNAALLQQLMETFPEENQGMTMFNDLRWHNDPGAITYIPRSESLGALKQEDSTTPPISVDKAVTLSLTGASDLGNLKIAARNMNQHWIDRKEKLEKINTFPKMGSYAWTISGAKTESGRATIYSGPQMGFEVPSIVTEGSIDAAGLKVSGMSIPGMPGVIIGRTPHHAWSMQVGHARTVDYYFEPLPEEASEGYYTSRRETIAVAGQANETIRIFRTPNGPVVNPMPFNPATYDPVADGPIISWRYSHWEKEFNTLKAFLELPRVESMDDFSEALLDVAISQHFLYADREGNIAYWMSGVDPIRPDQNEAGQRVDWRLPQGMMTAPADWESGRKPLPTDRNTAQGFYGGWNNKARADSTNPYNNTGFYFGSFHRTHVLNEYLLANNNLTFEEIRDLALYIATTVSFHGGGNPWAFVEDYFRHAIENNPTDSRLTALTIMNDFDGHFVAGGPENWIAGRNRSEGWILADAWIKEVLLLTFADELAGTDEYDAESMSFKNTLNLFNVLLRGLAGGGASLANNYDWFQNVLDPDSPQTAEEIIVAALDNVLAGELLLSERPWGENQRGRIEFNHMIFDEPIHTIPYSSRSTYAQVVEMADYGPARIESMFPLGQSGTILLNDMEETEFDMHFFSMTNVFDDFSHRNFPVFNTDIDDTDNSSNSSCFIQDLLR